MKTKRLLLGTLIAGILTIIFGGKTFATAGNTAEISGDKTWSICVDAGAGYAGSDFAVNITKTDFTSQIVFGNGDCKAVKMAAGAYTVSLNSTMGVGAVSYETTDDTLTFSVANSLHKYLNTFGSIAYTVEGSGEESQFELLFSMPGECQFNGNANVSGETCKDGDGNPLTNKKYIDTNVALFSEENAGRDFEVYFTLTDYASTQEKQGTLFNAKYENSSMYYPGFVIRTVNTDGGAMEITGRLGNDNTSADKANNSIVTADIKNKEVKIVRVGGMVSYSIDGGEMIPFQDYKNFSRYFNQTAVFGASMQTNGNPQRYYDGTIKNIRVYLKKVATAKIIFDANGGVGEMSPLDIVVGSEINLPVNQFTLDGATFRNWNTEADGSGSYVGNGSSMSVDAPGEYYLYAQWYSGPSVAVLDSGSVVNKKIACLANSIADCQNNDWQNWEGIDGNITSITVEDAPSSSINNREVSIISADSSISPIPIYAWYVQSRTDGYIHIYTEADTIYAGDDMSYMFSNLRSLRVTSGLANFDTSNTTNMNHLFYGVGSNVDMTSVADWDTSNVTDMSDMFNSAGISDFSAIGGWNTLNVVNMSGMFRDNQSLSTISGLAGWNTSSVTDMSEMFYNDRSIVSVPALSGWNTASLTNTSEMFYNNRALTDISSLAGWNTSSITNMSGMFYSARTLSDISALAGWDTSNVTDMSAVFRGSADFTLTSSLSDISVLANWNTSSVTNMSHMFDGTKITNVNALETKQYEGKNYVSWDVSHVTDMSDMFRRTYKLTNIAALASWNTSSVTDMSGMLYYAKITNVNALETKQYEGKNYVSWDVSHVTDMSELFGMDESLVNINALASWNTLNVRDMALMFYRTKIADVEPLRTEQHEGNSYVSWNVAHVENMVGMFREAYSLVDISALASWDTSSVTDMSFMFYIADFINVDALETKQYEGKNYVSWDVSHVTRMEYMFAGIYRLENVNGLASWDVSRVTDMSFMFGTDHALSDISGLASWNVSHVISMSNMFSSATSLADISALSNWNTSSAENIGGMFSETAITNVDVLETKQHEGKSYVSWDVSKVTSMYGVFEGITTLTDISALASWNTSSVKNMRRVFYNDTSLDDVSPVFGWDTSSVELMEDTFTNVPATSLPTWYQQ